MKVPLVWLADFLSLSEDASQIARRLTDVGMETTVEAAPEIPQGVVTARIVSCEKHPGADRLSVCTVDAGEGRLRTIVCGAPNARAGGIGAAALPGAILPGGLEIAAREVRGVKSEGMLCSAKELGLSTDGSGILLLSDDVSIGVPLAQAFDRGAVLSTETPANRGDWLSIEGVARELAAALRRPWDAHAPRPTSAPAGPWNASIADAQDCARYSGRLVEGLRPGASPEWITRRLEAAGIRPISNLVDATNFVLLERGHPLHAFDVDRLRGTTIGVRRARAGEILRTLDGKDRALTPDVLAITDGSGPVALAGIMGGESTRVTDGTTHILLEGASFHPARVRAGARELKMTTDASSRFERGVDPEGVPAALDRAVEILLEMCPGAHLVHSFDAYPAPAERRTLALTRRNLRRILGIEIDPREVREILERLGFEVGLESSGDARVAAPTFRRDVFAEEDLIEEVGRVYGYDKIPEEIRARPASRLRSPSLENQWKAREVFLAMGLTEVVTPALCDGSASDALLPADEFFSRGIPLRNPFSSDRDRLRGSLIPSLLEVLAKNRTQSAVDLAIFEVGKVFHRASSGESVERARAGVLLSGRGLSPSWIGMSKNCDFFDMKGIVEVYVEQLGGKPWRLEAAGFVPLGADQSARVLRDAREIGRLGDVGAGARKSFDLPDDLPVFWAELGIDDRAHAEVGKRRFEPLPRFPAAVRDLALVVPRSVTNEELEKSITAACGPLLESVRLFDVYGGPPLGSEEKSLAYTLAFRAPERSLTNEEVDALVQAVVAQTQKTVGARLR
jgi:phenylalanyl-tRNA synthetase beta chain